MIARNAHKLIQEALLDTPVVFIMGARQTGKSTLASYIAKERGIATFSFDDLQVRNQAQADPQGFIKNLPTPVVIDEVQRVPEIFLPIKHAVDSQRQAGMFILTGSSNYLSIPKVADSLAGRVEIINLWPLAQQEIRGSKINPLDLLFTGKRLEQSRSNLDTTKLYEFITRGGFPEALGRPLKRRNKWFDSYLATLIQRDIRDLSNIRNSSDLHNLVRVIAGRTGSLLNKASLASDLDIKYASFHRYFELLKQIYLVYELPAWSRNIGKQIAKAPKVHLADTGLASFLIGADDQRLKAHPSLFGHLLETFVVMELVKASTWSRKLLKLYHYRTAAREEIDCLIEAQDGSIVAVEIKASSSFDPRGLKPMKALEKALGKDFKRGIVIYLGQSVIPVSETISILPIQLLWQEA